MLPATLVLEQRTSTGSGEVHKYAVPRLDVGATLQALESGTYARAQLTAGSAQAALPPPPPREQVEPLPPPVGAPKDAQALVELSAAAAKPEQVRALRHLARGRGWLEEQVQNGDVWEPLETVLYDRYLALGGDQ